MLHVIPLGGLGEVGLNAMVVACRGEMLLIDCGLMFPTAAQPGVDIVVPDFTHLRQNASLLKGVLLTHGHEDHIGALPFLLSEVKVPVFGTRFTLGMVRHRLHELGVEADLREIEPRTPFRLGAHFTVEATRVTHTVPDAVGFVVRTPEGPLIHTGDFKLDPEPVDGLRTDLERWGELGDEGVLCLLSDSTNSERLHETGSEREVARTFERLFQGVKGRIVVGMFASHLHRVRHVLELAQKLERSVVPMGRSMVRNIEMARELGYLPGVTDAHFVAPEHASLLPPERTLILATGSQAEPRAGLSQLASGDGALRLGPGDLVVLSARAIPGNERAVSAMVDQFLWRGAQVVYPDVEPGVHVSGHASKPQQRRVLDLVRPKNFVPIHGELHHLHHHLGTARESGLRPEQLLLAKNGDLLAFEEGRGRFAGGVPSGRVYRDRFGQGEVTQDVIQERTRLAETGLLIAALVIDRASLNVLSGPQLSSQGLNLDEQALLSRVAADAKEFFLEMSRELRGDDARVREELVKAVRRAFRLYHTKRPVVVPMVLKV